MGEGRVHDGAEWMNENMVLSSSITMGMSSIGPLSPSKYNISIETFRKEASQWFLLFFSC